MYYLTVGYHIGEAIIGLPGRQPFLFQFKKM